MLVVVEPLSELPKEEVYVARVNSGTGGGGVPAASLGSAKLFP